METSAIKDCISRFVTENFHSMYTTLSNLGSKMGFKEEMKGVDENPGGMSNVSGINFSAASVTAKVDG